jgi:hypothetical protein
VVFIRRVRTTSGATAVQIAEYVEGRQRIVAHVGSAHTEAELGILMARARELLEPSGQDALGLGIEPTPPVTALLAARVKEPAQPGLFPVWSTARDSGGQGPVRAGIARVVATDTRVLFEALAGVYSSLGFDAVGDEVFRDLVIARIVEATSLLNTARVLTDLAGDRPATRRCGGPWPVPSPPPPIPLIPWIPWIALRPLVRGRGPTGTRSRRCASRTP